MQYDFLIVGAGISDAAAAFELSRHGSTALIEAEAHAGYHSTGRSAALYGLRSFVDDGLPVVGFDTVVPDFFWQAGQGGYGIMLYAALGRATAALIVENSLPQDFIDAALDAGSLSPGRLPAR